VTARGESFPAVQEVVSNLAELTASNRFPRSGGGAGRGQTPEPERVLWTVQQRERLGVRIPVDLGGCSGVIRALVPVDMGAVGAKRRALFGVGAKRRVKAHAEG
jgi:hypothetical protein